MRRPAWSVRSRRSVVVGMSVLAAVVMPLSACSGSDAQERSAPELLAAAKKNFDAAKSVKVSLKGSAVPTGVSGVSGLEGVGRIEAANPAFKGNVTGTFSGVTGTVGLLTIADKAWMKFFTENYQPFDLAAAGAPNPSGFFNPASGLSSFATSVDKPVLGDRARQGKDIIREVKGQVPGAKMQQLFALGKGTGSFETTFGITQDEQLRTLSITGPFYPGANSTYDIVLTGYGEPVDITSP